MSRKQFILLLNLGSFGQDEDSSEKKLLSYAKFSKFGSSHIRSPIFPDIMFCARFSCSKLSISPILRGTHPPKLLCAKTMTDTRDLPILSGKAKENLLLLTNIASKSISKSSLGSSPSNSLKRMSRYFRPGNPRMT